MAEQQNDFETPPCFEHDISELVLAKFPDAFQREVLKQHSISRQQNEWMMSRMAAGQRRFQYIEDEAVTLKKDMDDRLTGIKKDVEEMKPTFQWISDKKKIVTACMLLFFFPAISIVLGEYFIKKIWAEKPQPPAKISSANSTNTAAIASTPIKNLD